MSFENTKSVPFGKNIGLISFKDLHNDNIQGSRAASYLADSIDLSAHFIFYRRKMLAKEDIKNIQTTIVMLSPTKSDQSQMKLPIVLRIIGLDLLKGKVDPMERS